MALFGVGLGSIGLGVFATLLLSARLRSVAVATFGSLGCVLTFLSALDVLRTGRATSFHTSQILPLMGVRFTLDPLGAFFVAMVSFVGVAVLIYNVGYAHQSGRGRLAQCLLLVFIASLIAVPSASSVATFMFLWECMALSSMLLIVIEQRHRLEARSAAQWYGVITQLGAASILFGLLLLAMKGGQSFGDIRSHVSALSPGLRSVAFLATLIGFSSKAGAVPFHVWLPRAHPEAASPVSALMSGVMVAIGVYGILRVGGDLLAGGTLWWWLVVLALGALSAFYGALHATTSTDLKRLLAYSTIDMLGLVLVGVGSAGALRATGQAGIAQLALTGALMLLLAHAAFKGGLFLGAGAIERATGTRDLDQLGGLIHRLPITATFFGLSALSIMAVPALSGFSSEWLLLQGMLHGFVDTNTATLIGLLTGVTVLALTGGLTAVAFVKVLGVGLLGQARSPGAAGAHEVPRSMQWAMGLVALPSVAFGVVPGLIMPMVHRAVLVAQPSTGSGLRSGSGLVLAQLHGAIEPLALLGGFLGVVVLIWTIRAWHHQRSPRSVDAWRGGGEEPSARMQYTATSFGEPLQRVFADVLRPEIDVEVTHEVESRYYEQAISYESRVNDVFERHGYLPVLKYLTLYGRRVRRLQNGSVHRYLAFGFIALLVALVVLS